MYKITIEKIENKECEERKYTVLWIKEGTEDEKEYWYVSVPNVKKVTTELYSQTREKEINLFEVITAFNK